MHRSPFIEIIVRSYAASPRCAAIQPALARPLAIRKCVGTERAQISTAPWPDPHCANEPARFLGTFVRLSIALLLLGISLPSFAAVQEVGPIELTINSLRGELDFFTNVLPFRVVTETKSKRGALDGLLVLENTELRTVELRLGDEHIRLTEHLTNKGQSIPADSRSFDHWFQHIAIVVSDMDKAYDHLRARKVKHISTAPQALPAWNKDAGGIKAFYFSDPEDHVLEIIWFPPGKGDPRWQAPTTNLFLGIDHTAVVVSDTDRSLEFYTNALGLRVAGTAENHGAEQEHLNQVFGARLRITALRAGRGPGIELLEYIAPPGGRSLRPESRANDLAFWRTHLRVEGYGFLSDARGGTRARPVSTTGISGSFIVRDPDGHALELDDIRARTGQKQAQAAGTASRQAAAH
jgi:catechol 2,3-dioxygenase-like lactoylglutathione lyase family enzyme